MTTRTRTSRTTVLAALAALTAAVALTLAACSDEPEPEPTPTGDEESAPLEALLEDYLGDWSNEDVTRQLVLMEDLIATCMAEQGFDYTPVDYAAMELDLTGEALDLEWGSEEFAEQYGYGITTSPVLGEDAETPEDPNEAYLATMSPSEQEAYSVALYGANDAAMSDPTAAEDYDWQDAGCTGKAQNEVLSGGSSEQDDQFVALQDEMTQMMLAAADDPRLAQVNADWVACMADAGFPGFAKVGDAEAALSAEVVALQEGALGDADPTDPTDPTDPAVLAQAEAELAEQLDEITAREIDTAVADAECRAEVGYDDAERAVDTEYQTRFLAEHLTEVQAWMEALEERRSAD